MMIALEVLALFDFVSNEKKILLPSTESAHSIPSLFVDVANLDYPFTGSAGFDSLCDI